MANTISALAALRALHKGVLYLPIKQCWLDMIVSGVKKDEYRHVTAYYISRICPRYKKGEKCFTCPHFAQCRKKIATSLRFVVFHNYRNRRVTYKIDKIRIDYGKPEWGADIGLLFVISLGKKVYDSNTKNKKS